MTQDAPVLRKSARVVLLDPANRVLLFEARAPGREERPFWITPGGGLHPGEAWLDCVRREVWEETGLREVEVGPWVWEREHTFEWDGTWLRQHERYYLARAEAFEVLTDHQEDLERRFMQRHHWWTHPEIAAATDVRFVPGDFAALLEPLLCGETPLSPIRVGI